LLDFTGLREPAALRTVARPHVIAWRKHLESRELSHASIQRKLSALSSLFDYLCERNAVAGNPVKGSSGQRPIIMWAALRPWAMRRRGVYWRPPPDTLNGVSRHFVFGIGGRRSGVNGLQL
jgi:hypothetical protein